MCQFIRADSIVYNTVSVWASECIIAYLSAEDMLKSLVIEEKKFKNIESKSQFHVRDLFIGKLNSDDDFAETSRQKLVIIPK